MFTSQTLYRSHVNHGWVVDADIIPHCSRRNINFTASRLIMRASMLDRGKDWNGTSPPTTRGSETNREAVCLYEGGTDGTRRMRQNVPFKCSFFCSFPSSKSKNDGSSGGAVGSSCGSWYGCRDRASERRAVREVGRTDTRGRDGRGRGWTRHVSSAPNTKRQDEPRDTDARAQPRRRSSALAKT